MNKIATGVLLLLCTTLAYSIDPYDGQWRFALHAITIINDGEPERIMYDPNGKPRFIEMLFIQGNVSSAAIGTGTLSARVGRVEREENFARIMFPMDETDPLTAMISAIDADHLYGVFTFSIDNKDEICSSIGQSAFLIATGVFTRFHSATMKDAAPTNAPVSGTYYGEAGMLVESIEFANGRATFRAFGTVTGSFPYQQKGDTLYITDPSKGEYAFTIVDGKTIRTEVFGLAGTYRKR
jgi:hypothetical protein